MFATTCRTMMVLAALGLLAAAPPPGLRLLPFDRTAYPEALQAARALQAVWGQQKPGRLNQKALRASARRLRERLDAMAGFGKEAGADPFDKKKFGKLLLDDPAKEDAPLRGADPHRLIEQTRLAREQAARLSRMVEEAGPAGAKLDRDGFGKRVGDVVRLLKDMAAGPGANP